MEGGFAVQDAAAGNHYMDENDVISFDSDSSGDSRLQKAVEQQLLDDNSAKQTSTPYWRAPSDHREGVPNDSPPQRRSGKQRRRARASSIQEDLSPIPYSWYYNPYSRRDYSPSVSLVTPRKSISSWMEAMMRTPNQRRDSQTDQEGTEYDDDDVSIDSVERLEQAAAQIRSEIRQSELQELADEAENAAEAGQESFAGRASTFGDSTHSLGYVDLNDVNPKQQYKLKRYTTYSEGTSLLKQATALRPVRRARPKIRCLQLRDINEVIPPMGELHSHLKMHLMLSGVEQQSLEMEVDEEKEEARAEARRTPVQFLSSLKSWVSTSPSKSKAPLSPDTDVASDTTTPRKTTAQTFDRPILDSLQGDATQDEGSVSTFASLVSKEDSFEVGGRLSGHLHTPKAVKRSAIRVPTGLDLPDDLGFPQELPSKMLLHDADRTDVDTVETVPTSSSSQQDEMKQDDGGSPQHSLEDLTPIALFQQMEEADDGSSTAGGESAGTRSSSNSMLPASPRDDFSQRWAESAGSNMFITPMRLRGIRRETRRLSFDRSLSHKSADLGWTLKAARQTRQTCSDSHLPLEDDRLNIPLLSVKSDGEYSPVAPLDRSKDRSVVSLPEDISFSRHDEISLSMSGPPLVASDELEVSHALESTSGSMIADLDRPKSLSFDEHDLVEVMDQDFTKSLNDLNGSTVAVFVEEKLVNGCSGANTRDRIALQSEDSLDISVNVSRGEDVVDNKVLDAEGDASDLTNENNDGFSTYSAEPLPIQTLEVDESLPLMPTLDNVDEPKHADDSKDGDGSIARNQNFQRPATPIIPHPVIDKRPSYVEDAHVDPDVDTDYVSLHSMELTEAFAAETKGACSAKDTVDAGTHQTVTSAKPPGSKPVEAKDSLSSTERDRVDTTQQQNKSSDPVSEFYAKEELEDIITESNKSTHACEEIGLSDPISEFYASQLSFDEDDVVAATRSTEERGIEFEKEQFCEGTEIEMSQVYDAEENTVGQVTSPENLAIEVNHLNDSLSDIANHYQRHQDVEHSPSVCLLREEILKSPSGRVRVTIEQSLHDDTDEDDDDDVRSEATSVRTPQAHPCECLINAAAEFEENVRGDLDKASECARIRYDLRAFEGKEDDESTASRTEQQIPASTPLPAGLVSLQRESVLHTSMAEQQSEQKWSPMRRTHSCPSLLNLGEEEVDTSMVSSATIPHKGFAHTAHANAFTDRALAERRGYYRAYSMLDPCQSTSPFKETMDDMMRSLSPTKEFETERKAIMQAQENHDFLSNYLYSSKPQGEANAEATEANMCGDHCGYLSGVLDSYRSIIPTRSTSKKDMLSLNSKDKSYPASSTTETWFDVASEHFDGALEAFMGRAHAQSRRWNSMFQAPGLKSKKEIERSTSFRNKDRKGIVLVKNSSAMDSQVDDGGVLSAEQFESMYGMAREEFEQLPVTERSVLHDVVAHKKRRRWISRAPSQAGLEQPSPAISTRSLSSSDLAMMSELRV